jgi:6-phosphogluconolactonase
MRQAKLHIETSKDGVKAAIYPLIHKALQDSLTESSNFYIAMSGGSLPSLLSALPQSFQTAEIDPQWCKWHVLLADERLVSSSDLDSNIKALKEAFLDRVPIPTSQIYGIDESLLIADGENSSRHTAIAQEYEARVFSEPIESKRRYLVDCALLGFGPDGHTASLFPNHQILREHASLVAGIHDSPKPPLERITLTMKVFNKFTKNIIFVGLGESKAPILRDIFERVHLISGEDKASKICVVELKDATGQVHPCGMIQPIGGGGLVFVTDTDGAQALTTSQQCCSLL